MLDVCKETYYCYIFYHKSYFLSLPTIEQIKSKGVCRHAQAPAARNYETHFSTKLYL